MRFTSLLELSTDKIGIHPLLRPNGLRFLLIVLLVLGVFFRFVNLDRKVYWFDEAYTSLRISGYTEAELVQQAFESQKMSSAALQKYQYPSPEKSVLDTIKGLAKEEPQHPPLYYVMVRFWAQWFGSCAATMRSLSALFSLLVFPSVYWLCLELFPSSVTAWVAIALVAISPVHVVYAQEARQYSLWTVTILLSSASLLRAMRLNTRQSWGMYTATLVLALYTYLFSGLVALGHGIYVVVMERGRWTQRLRNYLLASVVSFLAFVPWILAVATNFTSVQSTTSWAAHQSTLFGTAKVWALNLRRMFFDLDFNFDNKFAYLIFVVFTYAFVLILQAYAIYFLCRHAPKRVWLFILTLIGGTALTLLLPDLILGGRRSTTLRYIIPCLLGIQIAVAHFLATQMTAISKNTWSQQLGRITMSVVVSLGVLSCAVGSQAETWWNKTISYYNPPVARIINQSPQPLLISKASTTGPLSVGDVLSLSRLLAPKVMIQLVVAPNIPKINEGFSDVFLFTNSKSLRDKVGKQQNARVEPAYKQNHSTWLWKLAKKS